MANIYNSHDVRPCEDFIRPELQRCLKSGIKLWFIAEVAGCSPKTLAGINSGRRKTASVGLIRKIDHAIARIERGTVTIPDKARRDPRKPAVQQTGGTHCTWGHEFTPENTRLQATEGRVKRVCKTCELKRVKAYQVRKFNKKKEQGQ